MEVELAVGALQADGWPAPAGVVEVVDYAVLYAVDGKLGMGEVGAVDGAGY